MAMAESTKIVHVELKQPADGQKKHYYFGSLKAIYDTLSRDDVGCVYTSLTNGNYGWNGDVLETKKAIIRTGEVLRCKQKSK